jgi:hypothetical protein
VGVIRTFHFNTFPYRKFYFLSNPQHILI